MKVNVTATRCIVENDVELNAGEYNINKFYFTFSPEYLDNYVKKALFVAKDKPPIEMVIANDECNIPYDILKKPGVYMVGVYAYEIDENNELILRYSPEPTHFYVNRGSYIENVESPTEPDPDEFAQYYQAMQDLIAAAKPEFKEYIDENLPTVEVGEVETLPPGSQATVTNSGTDRNPIFNFGIPEGLKGDSVGAIEIDSNDETYQIKMKLYDDNRQIIAESNTIDLPIENKVDKINGKSLSTNDFTNELKNKLDNVEDYAEVNVIQTISKNGTPITVEGKNVNIVVPTNTSDLNNDSGFINSEVGDLENYYDKTVSDNKFALITESGKIIDLSIDNSTYVMTITLKDRDANVLSSSDVDLPLETMVINASYDNNTKEIVLTLQSGTSTRFSVADLVSGLQSEITANNKLKSDLVDDTNQVHKFVTSEEKTTWNSKQSLLVSGTNIKTINNESILGSGNITIEANNIDVQINETSIVSDNVANISVTGSYNETDSPLVSLWDVTIDGSVPLSVDENSININTTSGNYDGSSILLATNDTLESDYVPIAADVTIQGTNYSSSMNNVGHQIEFGLTNNTSGDSNSIVLTPTETYIGNVKDPVNDGDAVNKKYVDDAVSDKSDFSGSYNDLTDVPTIPTQLDELSDDSTHRLVTDNEKSTWNGKQDTINDLETIRSGAASGKTAVQFNDLATVATSGSYNDLSNKPTIPTKLSQLSDDSTHRLVSDTEKTTWNNKSDFSGSYNDLSNKPTIPTSTSQLTNNSNFVSDGNYVHTDNNYTNAEKQKLANLENYDDTEIRESINDLDENKADKTEIPENTSDLNNDSGFITKNVNDLTYYTLKTSTGSLIDLEINQTTYVVTLKLKDIDGNVISTDTIDLPLENVVVSGSYDDSSQKIILTLQNGTTVDIPVGDLVAGLQTEITSTNKIASDLVDDSNSGNKFVTTSEKSTWNGKQDAITSSDKLSASLVSGLATVATSGSYNDLSNKPTIPTQVTESTVSGWGFTKNTGTITGVKMNGATVASSGIADLGTVITEHQDISEKQDKIVAGTNISIASDGKTISATDTTYSNATTTTAGLMSSDDKTKLNGIETGATKNLNYYGTCATAATKQAKVVVCDGFILENGATISVLFTYGQSYNGVLTLNVNSTGAKNIRYKADTNAVQYIWSAGEIIDFTYNGTYWIMHRSALATTLYYGLAKYSDSLTSTSSALGATPKAINTAMINIISGTPIYSASSTYNVGDRVRYSNNVWECVTAITTAEAWTEAHWQTVAPLQEQIDDKQDVITDSNKLSSDLVSDVNSTNKFITSAERTTWNNKVDSSVTRSSHSVDYSSAITNNGNMVMLRSSHTSDGNTKNSFLALGSSGFSIIVDDNTIIETDQNNKLLLKNVIGPVDDTDAANKKYVDDTIEANNIDVQINESSIVSNNVANILTEGVYGTRNKLLTKGYADTRYVLEETIDDNVGYMYISPNIKDDKDVDFSINVQSNLDSEASADMNFGVEYDENEGKGHGYFRLGLYDAGSIEIDNNGTKITKVITPTNDGDAVNKKYVDDIVISGSSTDVQINGTSIVSNNIANISVTGAYNETDSPLLSLWDVIIDGSVPLGPDENSININTTSGNYDGTSVLLVTSDTLESEIGDIESILAILDTGSGV